MKHVQVIKFKGNPLANQTIYCLGKSSCTFDGMQLFDVDIIDFEAIYCAGYQSCQSIYIKNTHNIYFMQNRNIHEMISRIVFDYQLFTTIKKSIWLSWLHQYPRAIITSSDSWFLCYSVLFIRRYMQYTLPSTWSL